jgi:predicted RNA-binding Zn-ribbon protein involved in translation (DUF1610 family)
MADCDGCGAHVSREYARVFADPDGVVHRCPECGSHGKMAPGDP